MSLPSQSHPAAPMRMIFVTTSLVHGGAERHSIALMNRLAERGHECHAVYVKNDPAQLDRIVLRGAGTVRCLDAGRFLDRRAVQAFARLIDRLDPAAIVCANPYALMYATLAGWQAQRRIPRIATYHSTRMLGLKEQVKMLIDRFFILQADCLVFVSENQRQYWQRRALRCKAIAVIPNGIDAEVFDPLPHLAAARQIRRAFGIAAADYLIGMVAILRPEKNHVQLVAAVAQLRRRGIPARALLIGDGPLRAAIETTARLLGVAPYIHIAGFQEDVRAHVVACDVVVLCSVTEALSLAAIEAMALGKPVVHSAVGGAGEVVLPAYNGYLFPVGDTAALVQRLGMLADAEHAGRLGRNARSVALSKFSEQAMVDRYDDLLHSLGQPRPAAAQAAAPPIGAAISSWRR